LIEGRCGRAAGNHTSVTTSAGTAIYTYPADSHRLIAVDGQPRNQDAAGNTTHRPND